MLCSRSTAEATHGMARQEALPRKRRRAARVGRAFAGARPKLARVENRLNLNSRRLPMALEARVPKNANVLFVDRSVYKSGRPSWHHLYSDRHPGAPFSPSRKSSRD